MEKLAKLIEQNSKQRKSNDEARRRTCPNICHQDSAATYLRNFLSTLHPFRLETNLNLEKLKKSFVV